MYLVRCYFSQRDKDESTLVKPGMRNGEYLAFHHDGVVEEQIQIHGAGALGYRSFPVEYVRLDPLQVRKQLVGGEGGVEAEHGVQKRILGYRPDRLRVIEA